VTRSAQETSRGLRMLDSASAGRPTPAWTIQPVQGELLPRSKSLPRRKEEAFLQHRCEFGQALMFMSLEIFRSLTCTSSSSLRLLTILAPSPLHLQSPISPLPSEGPCQTFPISSMMGKRPLAEILNQALRTARWRDRGALRLHEHGFRLHQLQ